MFESWVGEKKFQAGVAAYLKRYSFKNARVSDFLDAIAGAGQPQLTRAFSTFLEQPGVPLISVNPELRRRPGARAHPEALSAGRLRRQRQPGWQMPVCVRYKRQGRCRRNASCSISDRPSSA